MNHKMQGKGARSALYTKASEGKLDWRLSLFGWRPSLLEFEQVPRPHTTYSTARVLEVQLCLAEIALLESLRSAWLADASRLCQTCVLWCSERKRKGPGLLITSFLWLWSTDSFIEEVGFLAQPGFKSEPTVI